MKIKVQNFRQRDELLTAVESYSSTLTSEQFKFMMRGSQTCFPRMQIPHGSILLLRVQPTNLWNAPN